MSLVRPAGATREGQRGQHMNAKQALGLRERSHLGQTQFWNVIGLSQSAGSRYEHGKRRIPRYIELLLKLIYGTNEEAVALLARLRAAKIPLHLDPACTVESEQSLQRERTTKTQLVD